MRPFRARLLYLVLFLPASGAATLLDLPSPQGVPRYVAAVPPPERPDALEAAAARYVAEARALGVDPAETVPAVRRPFSAL